VPEWLTLQNAQGDVDDASDPAVIRLAAAAKLPILALVTNFRDGWRADELHALLNDAEARTSLVDNIHSNLREHGFAGVNIDFEGLAQPDREQMVLLMQALQAKLHPDGLLLTQSVPAHDNAYDLPRLAAVVDYLVVMAYDQHSQFGTPGPVASRPWFRRQIEALQDLPREKLIVGIGNYGYDWAVGSREATVVTFTDVMAMARSRHGRIAWDETTGNPVLRYQAGLDRHEVWFLDAVTALNQAQFAASAGVRGVGVWRLGAEDPGVWTVVRREAWPSEREDPRRLVQLDAREAVRLYGDGEILRVVETPMNGVRRLRRTDSGELAERYERYPEHYVLEASGRGEEPRIALTFDDGPDPQYTPQILDILRSRQVPATFFVVGVNAERSPGLLRRIYAEGHEIGNHTYSHLDLGTASRGRLRFELNATQRIIQHTLGVSTLLFRPPYAADSEPQTPQELEAILRAQQLGYITIGARIDPQDWEPGVTSDAILGEVLAEQSNGRIVLLHDAGGNRSATVEALPGLIDELRARGLRFVTVSELVGKTRDEVMPVSPVREVGFAAIAGRAFAAKGALGSLPSILFIGSLGLVLVRTLGFGLLSVGQKWHTSRRRFDPAFRPPVSVIIPAHNEATLIVGTVRSIVENGYPSFEILVIDDGSTDGTADLVQRHFGGDPRVSVHRQPKAGKVAALNTALGLARHDIIVAIDADTVVRAGTLEKLARHFVAPQVGAVSGNVRVSNRRTWITRFQSIEYICAFNLERRALDLLDTITVVPGAVGAWRKRAIQAVGGFSADTLAEDTDLTLAIRREGYRIRYDDEAIGDTEVPHHTAALVRQRFRWLFGTLQSAWKYRGVLFRPRYGTLGFVGLPCIWVFQMALPIVSPVAEIAMCAALVAGHWEIVVFYWCALFGLELVAGLLAYALERERPFDLVLLPGQRVYYRVVLLYVAGQSLVSAIRGAWVEWTKLERVTVSPHPVQSN
jgi:peptidoglycan/xylan/chitin deacetylase (PgdA/CDA1 family)/GT2 family glycosyltransferase